jgi:hypothetical protein
LNRLIWSILLGWWNICLLRNISLRLLIFSSILFFKSSLIVYLIAWFLLSISYINIFVWGNLFFVILLNFWIIISLRLLNWFCIDVHLWMLITSYIICWRNYFLYLFSYTISIYRRLILWLILACGFYWGNIFILNNFTWSNVFCHIGLYFYWTLFLNCIIRLDNSFISNISSIFNYINVSIKWCFILAWTSTWLIRNNWLFFNLYLANWLIIICI